MQLDLMMGTVVLTGALQHIRLKCSLPQQNVGCTLGQKRCAGLNGPASPLTVGGRRGGAMLARRLPAFTKEACIAAANHFSAEQHRLERIWSRTADKAAMATWGRPYRVSDYKISGIASDQFSKAHQDQLRSAAHGSTFAKDASRLHKEAARYAK